MTQKYISCLLSALMVISASAMELEIAKGGKGTVQYGTVSTATGLLSLREVTHQVSFDDSGLTVTQTSPLPPAPMKITAEDCAIIEVTPPGGKKRSFRIASSDTCGKMTSGKWSWTKKFTWKELGTASPEYGKPWKIQLVREFRNQTEKAVWSYPGPASVVFREKGTNFTFNGFGPRWKQIGYEITWSTAGRVKVDAEIVSIENPRSFHNIVDNGSGMLRTIMDNNTERTMKMQWSDPDTGRVLGKREFKWQRYLNGAPAGPIYVDPDPPLKLSAAFYPRKKRLNIKLSCPKAEKIAKLGKLSFHIVNEADKTVVSAPAVRAEGDRIAEINLPELPENKYTVYAVEKGKRLDASDSFAVIKFPWQDKKYGQSRLIVPPFRPLVCKDGKVQALCTGYEAGGILWRKINADGRDLLRGPVRLVANGEEFKFKSSRIVEAADDRVVIENDLAVSGLGLTLRQEYDYDGMCKLTFNFVPRGKVKIHAMTLEFPFDAEELKLFHSLGNGMRRNRCGFLPDADGTLWRADQPSVGGALAGFRPYIWFGGLHRGFCWFAESDENWGRIKGDNTLSLVRKGDTALFSVHLFTRPRVRLQPFSIVMGVQPTPVKKVTRNYRKLTGDFFGSWIPDNSETLTFCVSGAKATMRTDDGPNVPLENDWSYLDFIIRNTWKDRAEVERTAAAFLKKHGVNDKNWSRWSRSGDGTTLLTRMWQGARFWRCAKYHFQYFNPRALCPSWKEFEMYSSQWFLAVGHAERTFNDQYCCHPDDDYNDFILHHSLPFLDRGYTGLYFDNLYDLVMQDPWADIRTPGTRKVPYYPIWGMRDLIKRAATLCYERKRTFFGLPAVMVHMTDCNVVPWNSFAGITLDWEMGYGDTPYPTRFSDAYILTHTLGTQAGCLPWVLVNTAGSNGAKATDTLLPLTFGYDLFCQTGSGLTKTDRWKKVQNFVRNFGYGEDTTTVWPGWDETNPVKVAAKTTRCTTVRRQDGTVLLLVGNRGKAEKVTLTLPRAGHVTDALSKAKIAEGKEFSLDLPQYGWKMLIVKGNK